MSKFIVYLYINIKEYFNKCYLYLLKTRLKKKCIGNIEKYRKY